MDLKIYLRSLNITLICFYLRLSCQMTFQHRVESQKYTMPRWPIWSSPMAASGHSCRGCPNRHSWLMAQGHCGATPKAGKSARKRHPVKAFVCIRMATYGVWAFWGVGCKDPPECCFLGWPHSGCQRIIPSVSLAPGLLRFASSLEIFWKFGDGACKGGRIWRKNVMPQSLPSKECIYSLEVTCNSERKDIGKLIYLQSYSGFSLWSGKFS